MPVIRYAALTAILIRHTIDDQGLQPSEHDYRKIVHVTSGDYYAEHINRFVQINEGR